MSRVEPPPGQHEWSDPPFTEVGFLKLTRTGAFSSIDRFQVFGERRSGTNAVEQFLARNTNLRPTSEYGWKHGFPVFPVLPQRCLFLVVTREARSWLQSFYAAPFEAHPDIAAMSFADFLRAEWRAVYTPMLSNWKGHGYTLNMKVGRGEELQIDRHPVTGRRFRNVVELRNLKLAGHLSLLRRGVNVVLVRYEDFLHDRATILDLICDHYGIERQPQYDNLDASVGPRSWRDRPKKGSVLEPDDEEFIRRNLDIPPEMFCGYREF